MEHRALGKGLLALIPDKPEADGVALGEALGVTQLSVSEISVNSQQPRKNYDEARLNELKASIKENGVLQPILVRKTASGYEVVAGERRLRAAKALGLKDVPVVIKDVSQQEAFILALVENIQREELNAIEEAVAFKKLIEEFGLTQDQVAQSVSKDRTTISNILRLLRLPDDMQAAVSSGAISMGHARALLSFEDPARQREVFMALMKEKMSVRDLEELTKKAARAKKPVGAQARNAEFISLEEHMQKTLGTKVRILSKKKRGKIVIEFYSPTDLDRILKIFNADEAL